MTAKRFFENLVAVLLLAFGALLLLAGTPFVSAQPTPVPTNTPVQKVQPVGATQNDITGDFNIPSGRTVTNKSGGTFANNGTENGTGAWNFGSGTVTGFPASFTRGAYTFTWPTVSGTVITTGDTGTVTNLMLAGSIANGKLANSTITIAGTSTALGGSITLDQITGLSLTGLVKRTGLNAFATATSGTDYAPATSGASILYGNSAGGFSNVTVGTASGLSFTTGTLSLASIPNSSLANSAITIAGTSTALGASITLDAIDNGLAATGFIARTAANTRAARTITGTLNEISVVNGNGVSADPTLSLPSSLTFTGKTITGGTYASGAFNGTLGATTPAAATVTSLTDSGLTSGRVPFASTAGLLADAVTLTFNSGTGALSATSFVGSGASLTSVVNSIAGTAGNVLANGATAAQTGAVTLSLPTALTSINSVTSAAGSDLSFLGGAAARNIFLGATSMTGAVFVQAQGGLSVDVDSAAGVDANFGLRTASYNASSAFYLNESSGKIFLRWAGSAGIHVHSTTPVFAIDGSTPSTGINSGSFTNAGGFGNTGAFYEGGLINITAGSAASVGTKGLQIRFDTTNSTGHISASQSGVANYGLYLGGDGFTGGNCLFVDPSAYVGVATNTPSTWGAFAVRKAVTGVSGIPAGYGVSGSFSDNSAATLSIAFHATNKAAIFSDNTLNLGASNAIGLTLAATTQNAMFIGTITTAGTLTTAAGVTYNFGAANVVSPTNPNRTLLMVVGGTTYYVAAKTTND